MNSIFFLRGPGAVRLGGAILSALLFTACGGGGGGDPPGPPPAPEPPVLVPEAGTMIVKYGDRYGPGTLDGAGAQASFDRPAGLVATADGAVFVADSHNGMIRHVTRDGVVTTRYGKRTERGVVDGSAAAARFRFPTRMALAADGTLYVVDRKDTGRTGGVLRAIARDGAVSTVPGTNDVFAVAADKDGSLVLVIGHAVYRRTPAGELRLLAGSRTQAGAVDGPGSEARFGDLTDVAVGPDGVIYLIQARSTRLSRVMPGTGAVVSHTRGNLSWADGVAVDAGGTAWFRTEGGQVEKFNEPSLSSCARCPLISEPDPHFEHGLVFTSDGTQVRSVDHGLVRNGGGVTRGEFLAGAPDDINRAAGKSGLTDTGAVDHPPSQREIEALAVDNNGDTVALFFSDPDATAGSAGKTLKRVNNEGQVVRREIPDVPQGTAPVPMGLISGIAVDRTTNDLFGSRADYADPRGGILYRLAQDGLASVLATWYDPNAAPPGTTTGPLVGGQDGAYYFVDIGNGDLLRWTPAQGLSVVMQRSGYTSRPYQRSREPNPGGASTRTPLLRPHQLAVDRQGAVYMLLEGGLLRIRQGRVETLVAEGTFSSFPSLNERVRSGTNSNVAVDSKDRVFVADREVIYEVLADGRLQVRAGAKGSIGLRPGPLPASLPLIDAMVAGPDGTLHIFGGNQLAVLRID